jgi:hypothetical protein
MLRVDRRARFEPEGAWLWSRFRFRSGQLAAARPVSRQLLASQRALQADQPVALIRFEGRQWWWFRDCFYWEDDGLTAHDVVALVVARERRRRRELDRAHAALRRDRGGAPRREPIAREVRLAVWERDGGRCVECGSGFELQFDHAIPLALGGGTAVENLQLLCADCNRSKGAAL